MILGVVIILAGFYVEFLGAVEFNFGLIVLGWILIIAGGAILFSHLVELLF